LIPIAAHWTIHARLGIIERMTPDPCDEQAPLRPFDLDKASAAKDINDYLNHYITVMDTKATAFLAGNVGAATFLLSNPPGHNALFYLAIVLFAVSTVVAGGVIFPRLPASGNSVLFWGDIARHADFQSYQREFLRVVESGALDEQYCIQNFHAARLLKRKYKWLRWAIMLFGCAVFSAFGVYLMA
jgi:hypothetical protein